MAEQKAQTMSYVNHIASRNGKKLILGLEELGARFVRLPHNFHILQHRGQGRANKLAGGWAPVWTLYQNAAYRHALLPEPGVKKIPQIGIIDNGIPAQVEINGNVYREVGSPHALSVIVKYPPSEWQFYDGSDILVDTVSIFVPEPADKRGYTPATMLKGD